MLVGSRKAKNNTRLNLLKRVKLFLHSCCWHALANPSIALNSVVASSILEQLHPFCEGIPTVWRDSQDSDPAMMKE